MKVALASLRTGILELRQHIEMLDIERQLLAVATAAQPRSASDKIAMKLRQHVGHGIAKRRFDYNCIIISLYGFLEHYLEELIAEYAATVNEIVPMYDKLPAEIVGSHINLTFGLIQNAKHPKYKGTVNPAALIANLHSCLNKEVAYKLNAEAFSDHAENFRIKAVAGLCARAGVADVGSRLKWFSPFAEYLAKTFPERNINTLNHKEMFYYINDLAERRNEVAHGYVDNWLDNKILLEYVEYVEAFGEGLYTLLCEELSRFLVAHKAVDLGLPFAVFKNCIVCVELKDTVVSVGDTLIASTGNRRRPHVSGQIEEIQIEHKSVRSVPPSAGTKVALRVGFRARKTYRYAVVQMVPSQAAGAGVAKIKDNE